MNIKYSPIAKIQNELFNYTCLLAHKISNAKTKSIQFKKYDWKYISIKSTKNTKDTIILIHGFSDSPESFLFHINKLRKDYNIILPYLPGFDNSEVSDLFSYNLDFYTDGLSMIIDEEKIHSYHLIGHSLGGAISLKLYEKFQLNIKSLILIDPLALVHKDYNCVVQKFSAGFNPFAVKNKQDFEKMIAHITYKKAAIPFFFRQWLFEYTKANYKNYTKIASDLFSHIEDVKKDVRTLISFDEIKTPTHLIWGDKDVFFPIEQAIYLNECYKIASLNILKDTGHCPHLETPLKLKSILEEILKK